MYHHNQFNISVSLYLVLSISRLTLDLFAWYNRGYNIGTRLIEDLLARTGLGRCKDFAEVGEVMTKVRLLRLSTSYHPH